MNSKIEMYGGKMTFTQAADCCNSGDQELQIEVLDGGAGKYFVLKTEAWAFDKEEEFMALMTKVRKAFEFDQPGDHR